MVNIYFITVELIIILELVIESLLLKRSVLKGTYKIILVLVKAEIDEMYFCT